MTEITDKMAENQRETRKNLNKISINIARLEVSVGKLVTELKKHKNK